MDVLTLILLLIIGYLSKALGYLSAESSKHFLRYIFYIGFPALTFHSILNLEFSIEAIYVILANVIMTIALTHIALQIGKMLNLPKKDLGTFVAISVIMNYSVIYVFAYKIFGELGLSYMAFFTFGHTITALTYTYLVLKTFNPDATYDSMFKMLWDLMMIPLVLSVIAGVAVNLLHITLPDVLLEAIKSLGYSSIPLVLIALGLLIEFKTFDKLALAGSLVRVIGGALMGVLIAWVLPLGNLEKWIIIIGGMAPVGFMSAVYAEVENLNPKMAANAISLSLIISLALLTLLSIVGPILGWF